MKHEVFGSFMLGNRIRIFPCKIILVIVTGLVLVYITFYSSQLLQVSVKSDEELATAHKKILELSKKYVKDLSDQLLHVEDGPAAYPDTGFNMKKALAVLISDLNERIDDVSNRIEVLEKQVLENQDVKESRKMRKVPMNPEAINAADLVNNKQDVCPFPSFEDWPYCESKIGWMQEMWESDPCYAQWGVDGGDCTILVYLSEQEHWCPPFPWRVNKTVELHENHELAEVRLDFSELMEKMGDSLYFGWIKSRVKRMSTTWIEAGKSLSEKPNLFKRRKKKVLFHMGLLSDEVGWQIAKNAFSGGPLGELVQWSDVISAVYMLGHDVTLTKSVKDLQEIYNPYLASASSNCPLQNTPFDIVYSDITGLKMLRKVANKKFHLLDCNVRVLDSFGTEPEFNHPNYASKKLHKTAWGKWNLNPKQFNTMFPHSPDNTFLGFVVEEHLNDSTIIAVQKENIALVYGKRDKFWEDQEPYISALHEVIEVHSTVDESAPLEHVPNYVHNHGILPGFELHKILRRAKIFVGLGFPYEGPAPLEAIANGAVYLNPVFKIPKDSLNTQFFKGKPTLRKLTSQHPYAEMYIGPPHVRSVEIDDLESLKSVVNEIINSEKGVEPFMPYEFTCAGMLERLSLYLEKQDFCSGKIKPVWPPESALQIKITNDIQSCSDICHASGLICEPSYFPILNNRSTFSALNITCSEFLSTVQKPEIDYPAFLQDKCFLQTDTKLFSCAGRYTNMHRLCPCRDYLPGQVALCKDCLNF